MTLDDDSSLFLFSWDCYGIEGIIDLTAYADWNQHQLLNMLSDRPTQPNPAWSMVQSILMRARHNGHRHYEVYIVTCNNSMTENYWREQWALFPQNTAEVVRARGHKLWSDRAPQEVAIR